jgi:hypothetical protein
MSDLYNVPYGVNGLAVCNVDTFFNPDALSRIEVNGFILKTKPHPKKGDCINYKGKQLTLIEVSPKPDYSFKSRKTWTRRKAKLNSRKFYPVTLTAVCE